MKRLSIILCFLLMGCSCEQECIDCLQAEIVVEDGIDSLLMENDSLIHEIFLQLDKTIDLEKNVKKTIRKKNITYPS